MYASRPYCASRVHAGSGTFLVVRLTETDGKLSYNTSVAVLLTECLKLFVARCLAFATEKQPEREAARRVTWAEWWVCGRACVRLGMYVRHARVLLTCEHTHYHANTCARVRGVPAHTLIINLRCKQAFWGSCWGCGAKPRQDFVYLF